MRFWFLEHQKWTQSGVWKAADHGESTPWRHGGPQTVAPPSARAALGGNGGRRVTSPVVSEVECPGCGAVYEFLRVQKTAEEFCPGCDYPLFWAARRNPMESQLTSAEAGLGPTLRRRPGAAGLQLPAGTPCPDCRELNPPGTDRCLRCGAAMEPVAPRPEPVVVVPPPPPPPAPPPPPPPAQARHSVVPVVIAVLAAVVAVQLLVLLLR